MRITSANLLRGVGLTACLLAGSSVLAAGPGNRPYAAPASYNDYAVQAVADDSSVPPAPPTPGAPDAATQPMETKTDTATAPAAGAASCSDCGGGCSTCNKCHDCWIQDYEVGAWGCALTCPTPCPQWSLFGQNCFLKEHNMTINGWIDGGYTQNVDPPRSRFNGPMTYNDRSDDFEMNQLYISMARAVKTDSCCWDIGGKIDLLYGTDARFTKAIGLETHDDGSDKWNSQKFYQISAPQLYTEIGHNNWDILVGRWYTPIGNEVAHAPDNFFYSHAYSFQYGEPLTHTGIIATKKVNDQFSFSLGGERGWDQWDDFLDDDRGGFIGGVSFATKDQKTKLVINMVTGDEVGGVRGNGALALGNRTLFSSVFTRNVNDRLTYTFQNDYGVQQHGSGANFTGDAVWYSVVNYLNYQINCNWWGGLRFEWFRDEDGSRVGQTTPPGDADTSTSQFGSGYRGSFYEVSLGLNYKPVCNPNLVVRPELRYDWYQGRDGFDAATGAARRPFDDGKDLNQLTAAFDAIYKF